MICMATAKVRYIDVGFAGLEPQLQQGPTERLYQAPGARWAGRAGISLTILTSQDPGLAR
jgi:hypothetical protein